MCFSTPTWRFISMVASGQSALRPTRFASFSVPRLCMARSEDRARRFCAFAYSRSAGAMPVARIPIPSKPGGTADGRRTGVAHPLCLRTEQEAVSGGAIFAAPGSRVTVEHSIIRNNRCNSYGAGMYVHTSAASFIDTKFHNNVIDRQVAVSAYSPGGGLSPRCRISSQPTAPLRET